MDLWKPARVSAETQQPELLPTELNHAMTAAVSIYPGHSSSSPFEHGILTVTSHRLIWHSSEHDKTEETCMDLALSRIQRAEATSNVFQLVKIKRPRVVLHVTGQGEGQKNHISLAFKNGGHDIVLEKVSHALQLRAWERTEASTAGDGSGSEAGHSRAGSSVSQGPSVFTPSAAGVSGLVRRVENEGKTTHAAIDDAFSDLEALMNKAQDLVQLAEKLQRSQDKTTGNASSGDGAGNGVEAEETERQRKFRDMLLNAGIAVPVTRSSHGALYDEQLARQLATFLRQPLESSPGQLMPVMDIYTLFNRARGTELLSPEDLYRACLLLSELNLGMHMIEYQSGVRVVQLDSRSSQEVMASVHAMVRARPGVTSVDVARQLGFSVVVARAQLELAERSGLLCRDESFEGLRFYDNQFPSFEVCR
eukprot:TRINITY_DN25040_c0_g1_i1.p1 TRINITY_DN25040_c0_g1~~TRINITY_DN25040_c0_g1_i1.p1  ORF type:complete len:422 (-),score=81.94 TRINITY_DN25040_c0_g1_i1:75-1340(-)